MSQFFSIYLTITGAKNNIIVRYTEDFIIIIEVHGSTVIIRDLQIATLLQRPEAKEPKNYALRMLGNDLLP